MSYNQGGYGGGGYGGGGYGNSGYNNNAGGGYGSGGYGQQQQQGGYNSSPYGGGGAGYGGSSAGGNAGRYEPNRYGGAAQTGYGQQSSNPYNGGNAYGQQQSNGYGQGGQGGYGGDSIPMTDVGAANGTGGRKTDKSIFGEARDIVAGIDSLENKEVPTWKELQSRSLSSSDPSQYRQAIVDQEVVIDRITESFSDRLKALMARPGSTNDDRAEISRAMKKLEDFHKAKFGVSNTFEQKQRATRERQYKIANPKASGSEVREAVEQMNADDDAVFSQALLKSDRKGRAASTLTDVRSRHEAIMQVTKDMEELTNLFMQMNTMVVEQQAQVDTIEHQAQNVEQDVEQANVQLDGAVVKARAARKKKWICLGIVVAIILVIIIIIIIVVVVRNSASKTVSGSKRAITL